MRKRLLCVLLALMLLMVFCAGCGAGKSKSNETAAAAPAAGKANEMAEIADKNASNYSRATASEVKTDGKQSETARAEDATGITGSGVTVAETVSNVILAQRKIIRNANVTIEVDDFDIAYGKINSFILGIGFIAQSNIDTEKVYVDGEQKLLKSGVIVVRVDKDRFDKVLNDIKGLGVVLNESIGVEDVTSKYYDVESRLRLLRFEESRLEEYLKKLTDPDQIFKTESRLTDIRHEIEGLTVTLTKLNDLIELATITINMNEVIPGSTRTGSKPVTYGDRLLKNFLDSVRGVVHFCGELLVILVQALPVIILLGLFVLIVLVIYRKIARGSKISLPKKDKDLNNGA